MATTMHPYDIAISQGAADAEEGREPDPVAAVQKAIWQAETPVTETTERILIDRFCTGYYGYFSSR